MNSLRASLLAVAGLAGLSCPGATHAQADGPLILHVSPTGNDAHDGSAGAPVASLAHARDLARAARAAGRGTHGGVVIALASGTYVLDNTLRLDARDSGTPGSPTLFQPEAGASPRIVGGVVTTGWHAGAHGQIMATWSGVCPSQLYVNGARRERPRLPATGMFHIGQVAAQVAGGPAVNDHFMARGGDIPASFSPSAGTELVVIDAWTASRMRLTGFDAASGRLGLRGQFAGRHGPNKAFQPGLDYYIENQPVEQLAPGNWQCDSDNGMIRYQPLPGEHLPGLTITAPRLDRLLVIAGQGGAPAHDIIWRGISFAYTGWTLPDRGWAAMQAEVGLPSALEMSNCSAITLDRLTVSHTGANAIGIGKNCAGVKVTVSTLSDLGGNGIAIGSSQRKPVPGSDWDGGFVGRNETHDILVSGNDIHALGRIQPSAVGVWSGQAHHVSIVNNRISDLFYSGISIGWVWNDGPSLSHDNTVNGNVIRNFGQGYMSDFGGIYTLGRQDRTEIAHNDISDGKAREYGGHGLYADQGSAGITFHDNRVARTSQESLQITGGAALTFRNDALSEGGGGAVYCDQASAGQSVLLEDEQFQSAVWVPVTRGVCSDPSYGFRNWRVTRAGATVAFDKPFGMRGAGQDYVRNKAVAAGQP